MSASPAPEEFTSRLSRLRARLEGYRPHGRAGPIDALIVSNITNIGYLSGFTGSSALILITAAEAFFLTDSRYSAQARRESPHFDIIETGYSGSTEPLGTLLNDRPRLARVGFESAQVTVRQLAAWKKMAPAGHTLLPTEDLVEGLRLIKDQGEVARIREAIRIAEKAFAEVRPRIVAGISERELAIELDFAMRRLGADGVAFETIVASGPNGAYPHHHPTDRVLTPGDLVTIDWGAIKAGYVSDLTRTLAVPGAAPAAKLVEIHGIVQDAKEKAIAEIRPGLTGKDVDSIARTYIAEKGYGEHFGHSLGHSIGRAVHDGTTLSFRAEKLVLEPGMVTTVEPGIYIDALGGVRIEEDVLVTATGHEVLSVPSKGL